jgi:beta-phosphoglucomutase-like phosphatase (HAD superfamily)
MRLSVTALKLEFLIMVKQKASPARQSEQQDLTFGIIFDLDETAFNGRKILYDVCSRILTSKKLEFSLGVFCRYFLDSSIEKAVADLIAAQGRKIAVDKIVSEIRAEYAESMTKDSRRPDPDFAALLGEAVEKGVRIGAFSFLPEAGARALLKRVTPEDSAELLVKREGSVITRESWIRLARIMGVNQRCCMALASCAAACRTALAAGLKCAVAANEFTVFQDFAGADAVAESVKELVSMNIPELLFARSAKFRRAK